MSLYLESSSITLLMSELYENFCHYSNDTYVIKDIFHNVSYENKPFELPK